MCCKWRWSCDQWIYLLLTQVNKRYTCAPIPLAIRISNDDRDSKCIFASQPPHRLRKVSGGLKWSFSSGESFTWCLQQVWTSDATSLLSWWRVKVCYSSGRIIPASNAQASVLFLLLPVNNRWNTCNRRTVTVDGTWGKYACSRMCHDTRRKRFKHFNKSLWSFRNTR